MNPTTPFNNVKKNFSCGFSEAKNLLFIFLMLLSAALAAQPNNNCASATPLTVGAACTNGTTVGATLEAWEPAGVTGTGCWGTAPSSTVWYTFTTGAAGNYTVSTDNGGSNDTQIKILSGTCGAFTAAPGCSDDDGSAYAFAAVASATLPAATTYYVQVDYYGAATGPFCISVSYNPPVTNDCIFNAIDITSMVNGINPGNSFDCAPYTYAIGGSAPTMDMVNGNTMSCDLGPDYRDIWFSFTITPTSPDVWIDVYQATGTTPDYTAAVYSGTPGGTCGSSGNITGLTLIDCSDGVDAGGALDVGVCTTPIHSRINVSTLPPGTYYYRVWEWGGGAPTNGIINMCVESATPVGITSDPCPTAPTMGLGCGAANTNINETYTNLSNAGCLGNACNTALNEPQLAVGGAGNIHNNCTGPWLTSVGYLNNVMNNSAIYAFNVNGTGTCQASVTISFNNIEYAGTNGNVMQVQVMNAPCAGGSSAVMAGTTSDPCFEMRPTSGTLPNGTYYIVVDGQDGQLVEFDLTLNIAYNGVGCTPSTPPPPPVAVHGSRCGPGTVNLSVTGCSGTAKWYAAPTGGTAFFSGAAYTTPSLSSTTTYYVSCMVGSCESARTPVTATINPPPSLTVNSATVCAGQTTTITATPSVSGGTYAWSPGGGATASISVSPAATTSYTVTYTLGSCSNTAVSTITVTPAPAVSVNSPMICAGQTATLTATSAGGGTYAWAPGGATTPGISVSPASTTTYTVTYTLSGCSNTATGTVTVNPVPTVSVNSPSMCSGASAALTATTTGAGTYAWSPGGGSTQNITVSPAATTTYTVTYTLSGCSNTAAGTVTVNPVPSVTVNTAAICAGGSATLTATPSSIGGTYSWSPGGGTAQNITVSPAATTTYTVTYTQNGCSGTNTGTVTVNPVPTVTVNSPTICNGASVTLSATPSASGGTYSWSPGAATTQDISVSPSTTTTYSVTYSLSGCTNTGSGTVTVTPNPVITVNSPSMCNGSTATLTGGGGVTYIWSNGASTNPVSVSPLTTTSYTVTGTSSGCSGTAVATVTVNAVPTATVSGGGSICAGSTSTVNVALTGASPWSFTYSDGSSSNTITGVTTSPYVITTGSNGTYSVSTVSDANCTGTSSGSATVTVMPNIVISSVSSACNAAMTDYTVTFQISGGDPSSYTVTGGAGTISSGPPYVFTSDPIPAASPNYSFTVNDANNCAPQIVSGTQNCNCAATAAMSGGGTICAGSTATINVNLTGTGPWNIVYNDGSANIPVTGIMSSPYVISTGTAGNYSLTGMSDANCVGSVSGSAVVTVTPVPAVNVNPATMCPGGTASLTANPTVSGGTYAWSPGGGTTQTISVSPAANTTYTVTYTLSGCSGTGTGTVTLNTVPTASMSGTSTICPGATAGIDVIFTGTAPWSFSYTDGSVTNTITGVSTSPYTITTGTAGTYSLVSVSDAACNGTVSGSGSISTVPPIVISSLSASCNAAGTSYTVTFTISGGDPASYMVTGGTGTITASSPYVFTSDPIPASAPNYSFTVNDAYNCSPQPVSGTQNCGCAATSTMSGGGTICAGSTADIFVDLTGTAPWTITYSDGSTSTTVSGISSSPYVITTGTAGNYSVVSVSDLNCVGSSSGTASVIVNSIPSVSASSPVICEGQTAIMDASGATTYVWSSGGTSASESVAPLSTTTYTVTGTSAGCSATAVSSVTVNPSPSVSITDQSMCAGTSATLTATPATTGGSYSWTPGGASTDAITVSPSGTTTYTVSYTLSGCPGTATGTVTVNPLPTVILPADMSVCVNSTIPATSFSSSPSGATYTWVNSNTLIGIAGSGTGDVPSFSANNASSSPITATIIVTPTLGGCTGPAEAYTITVNPDPTAFVSGGGTLCNGASATINVSFTGVAPWNMTYTDGATNTAVSGIATPTYSFTTPVSGTYSVIAVSDANCNGTASGSATVSNYAPVSVSISGLTSVCPGSPTTLTASASGGSGPYGYSWSPAGGGSSITVSPSVSTTYTVTASDGCATPGTASVTVNMLPVPTVAFSSNVTSGCAPLCINLTDASFAPGGSVTAWSWTLGSSGTSTIQNPSAYCFTVPGQYDIGLTVTGSNGCTATLMNNNMITVNALPDADIMAPQNVSILDASVSFTSASTDAVSWSWDFGDPASGTANTSSLENPVHAFSAPGVYCVTLTVTSAAGCTDVTQYCVMVEEEFTFFIPNAFTPDGDGVNDEFFGKGQGILEFEMRIFDRWGNLVFKTNDIDVHWNGSINNTGEQCQMDVYVYQINLRENGRYATFHNYNGKVTLVK